MRAAEIDLVDPMHDFVLREPPDPPPPGGPHIYASTGGSPAWFISQWNIAGGKLSPFVRREAGGTTRFESRAAAAAVTITRSPAGTRIALTQDGSALPCSTAKGEPREFDLFISPPPFGPGRPADRPPVKLLPLSELSGLLQIATVRVSTRAADAAKGCRENKGKALISLILSNTRAKPNQTLFYQLGLSHGCVDGRAPEQRRCGAPPRSASYFFRKNPFGVDDMLPLLGERMIADGETRALRIDLLPRLLAVIADAPEGMDRDPANWTVTSVYGGQHIWGDIVLTTEWSDYRLVMVTR